MADAKPLAPFTPGPLHVTREVDSEGYSQHTVRASTGSPLAVLSNYSVHEQKANATLYAAAPKLLAALRGAVAVWNDYRIDETAESRAALAASKAAIAEATGVAS